MTSVALIQQYEKTAELNSQRLRELDFILTKFESAHIQLLPLKGADLLGRAYGGTLGLRPMVDVDLLFRPDDLQKIERILDAHGFHPRGECGNPTYVSTTEALSLDLFPDIWYLDDMDDVWNRTVTRRIAGRMRPAMHPEDALVYLVAYQTIHRGRLSPQMARDVALLLDAEGQFIGWQNVIGQATRYHLRLALYHGLSYARDTGHAKLPSWVVEALRPPAGRRALAWAYQRLVTEDGIPELGHFLLVLSRPGLRKKLANLRHMFFPPREFLALRYSHNTRAGRFWSRLVRPFHLLRRASFLLLRISRRLLLPSKG